MPPGCSRLIVLLLCFSPVIYAQPDWIKNKPSDSQFYFGIGSSLISDSTDYKSIAKNNALMDLASEIFVNISSETTVKTAEKLGLVESEFNSIIRANTKGELSGYELVEEWQGQERFWSFYKLSKGLYSKIQEEKKVRALKSSMDYFEKAKSYTYPENISEILNYNVLSLKALDKYLAEDLKISIEGKEIYIINEIISETQRILNNISIEPVKKYLDVKYGRSINTTIQYTTKLKKDDKILSNIPLKYYFKIGSGKISNTANSGFLGIGNVELFALTSFNKNQLLRAEVDLTSFLNHDTSFILLNKVINSFQSPWADVELKVSGVKALIVSKEINLGEPLNFNIVEPALKNLLSNKGFLFVENEQEADYRIFIEVSTRSGSELYGQFTAFLDANISVRDISSGEEIFKESKQNIKGFMLDYEGAGLNAFQNSTKVLSEEIIPAFIKQLELIN